MRCAACGGNSKSDEHTRRVMGCDKPLPAGRQHVIKRGHLEPFRLDSCPRKMIRPANNYFSIYNWASKGLLEFQYDSDTLPAKCAEALELIDHELDIKSRVLTDAARKQKGQ